MVCLTVYSFRMYIDLWGEFKSYLLVTLTGLLSILSDFQYAFVALFVGFVGNFLMGLLADTSSEPKVSFSIKKATEGLKLFMFYVVTVFCLYGMTYKEPALTDTVIKWLTYIVSYFYMTNIFRNAKKVFPDSKAISFIYSFLSTEVFMELKRFLGIGKNRKFDNDK